MALQSAGLSQGGSPSPYRPAPVRASGMPTHGRRSLGKFGAGNIGPHSSGVAAGQFWDGPGKHTSPYRPNSGASSGNFQPNVYGAAKLPGPSRPIPGRNPRGMGASTPAPWQRDPNDYYGQQGISDAVAQKLGAWTGKKPWETNRPTWGWGGRPQVDRAWQDYQRRRDALVDFESKWGSAAVQDWRDPRRMRGRWGQGPARSGVTDYYGQQALSDAVKQRLGAYTGYMPWQLEAGQWGSGRDSRQSLKAAQQQWADYQRRRDALVDFESKWGSAAVADWEDPRGAVGRYAGGGYVKPKGYAGGGAALGTDTVPAMLTPGEFVVSRPAVQKIGLSNLMAMNAAGGGTNRPTLGPGGVYARGGGPIGYGFDARKKKIGSPIKPSPRPKPTGTKPFTGSNNSFLSGLAADYQSQMDAANAANEHRYQQILAGYDRLREDTLGNLDAANKAASAGYQGVVSGYGDLSDRVQAGYGNLQNFISDKYDAANAANESQYQNILGSYSGLQDRVLGDLDRLGASSQAAYQNILGGYGDLRSSTLADMDAQAAANESQYQQMIGSYGDLQDRTLTGLDAANAARDAEYANILGSYGGLRDRTLEGMRASDIANAAQYQNILGGYGDLRGRTLEGMDTSSAAAEARYADMAGRYGDLRERTLAGMEKLGQDQLAESRKAYDQSLAATTAQQAARGLGGTTVGASIKQGTDRGYQDAVRGIQESVLARKAAADMGLTQGQLSMEERFQGARDAAAARRTAADMGLTQAQLGQETRFQSAREAAQARQVAADMGLSQAQIGAQTQFANAKEAAAARRAAMDVGLTQAQIGQSALFQNAREAAQNRRTAAGMSLGQAQLGMQAQFEQQRQNAAERRAAMDVGLTQAQMGQAAQFQRAREAAQAQRIAAQMGISQSQLASMTGLGQAGLAAQSQLVNQMQSSADRRAAIDQGLTQAKLGAIERREDIAPNFNNLVTIAQGMAAGGYGEGYDGASDIKKLLAKLPSGMGKVDTPEHWGKFPRPKPQAGKAKDKWESDYANWIAQNIEADASGGRDAWEHAAPFTEGMNRETIAGQYAGGEPPRKLNPYEQLASGLLGR